MSQLELSAEAEVSARHLSFVETGRSRPSRELVLHLAEHLDVPLRERNALLLAAGYAPGYHETALDAPEMTPVRDALAKILAGHAPFPAIVVDHRWDLVSANEPAFGILADSVTPDLLAPPINAMRVSLHPEGLAPRITNFPEYSAHVMLRLRRQAVLSGDPDIDVLVDELRAYPGVVDRDHAAHEPAEMLFTPLALRHLDTTLTFFSTIATFGTALDVTVAELAIESFFPADPMTAATLRAMWDPPPSAR